VTEEQLGSKITFKVFLQFHIHMQSTSITRTSHSTLERRNWAECPSIRPDSHKSKVPRLAIINTLPRCVGV